MPVRVEKVPDELRAFLPEESVEKVVVGNDCYEMAPLPAAKAEQVATEIIEIIASVFNDLSTALEAPVANVKEAVNLTMMVKRGLLAAVKDQRVQRIAAVALDLPLEDIQQRATIRQLHHIIGCIWKQNVDPDRLPEVSRKNMESLLAATGLRRQTDRVYQWADFALRTLSNPHAGLPEERIVTVLRLATENGLLDPAETERMLKQVITPSSPASTDSPASTSPDAAGSSAP